MSSFKRFWCASTIAAVAVLAGCGSSGPSTVAPGTYVKSICQAVAPFENDVEVRSNALNVTTLKNPAQGKKALQDFLSAVSSDSQKAISRLKAAGVPKVSNGKAIAESVVNAFSQLKSTIDRGITQAQQLPTSSAQAFKTAAQSLGNTVRSSLTNIGAGLGGLKNPDLEKAAASQPACQSLGA